MRSLPRVLVPALAFAILLAGCVKPEAAPAPPAEEEAPVEALAQPAPTATLDVTAVFSDRTPLAGVLLTLGNDTRTTGPDGRARFEGVPAGAYTLVATKTAHRAAQLDVHLTSGDTKAVEIVLAPEEGGQHAHKPGFEGHRDVYRFEGHFDCSATYVIITGDCLIVVENVTKTVGAPDPVSGTTTERHVIDFPLDTGWGGLVVELAWGDQGPFADGMTLALEPAEAPADGHAAKYARVHGSAALRVELRPGEKHPSATQDDMPNPDGGEVIRARAFVRGHQHNPGGTDFLGAGFARETAFTLWVSTFYAQEPPAGYTAMR